MKKSRNRFDIVIYEVEPRTLARHGKEIRKKAKHAIGICLKNNIGHALISTYNGEMIACLKSVGMMQHFRPIRTAIAPCKRLSILQGILAQYETIPGRACYVGQRGSGLRVAREMGLYTIALIPHKRRRKRPEIRKYSDVIVRNFDDVLRVFGIPNSTA